MRYTLSRDGEHSTVVYYPGQGEPLMATNSHPHWDKILKALEEDNQRVNDLFDVSKAVETGFRRVSERVTLRNGEVFFDGDRVNGVLVEHLMRAVFDDKTEKYEPLALFLEKVMTNPNEHSRDQLYRWLSAHNFTIDSNGDIVGYKGVAARSDGWFSQNSGNAIVNGEPVTGQIPQPVGGLVEMPRGEVQHDPSVGCHTGLHVGTWDYAHSFARDDVLEVRVNPRDVVSVPTDSGDQKMRTCRYTVVGVVTLPHNSAILEADFDYGDSEPEDDYFSSIDSSVVSEVSWLSDLESDGILTVVLNNGNEYEYEDVPYSVFKDFQGADSLGRFYNEEIKGKFSRA